jgi:REP element-mobilizing transposase RayT
LKDSKTLAWVLMPDHLHILVQLGATDDLSKLVDRVKSATARAVNRELGREGPLWMRSFHDHLLRREEDVATVARYIVANSLRAGIADTIGAYSHWDVTWL